MFRPGHEITVRLLLLIMAVTVLYFAFSVWALERHDCLSLIDYLGPPPPEYVFWCGDLRYALGFGYLIAPIIAAITLGLIAFKRLRRRFEISRLERDPRFLRRIEQARANLRAGRGTRLEDIEPG